MCLIKTIEKRNITNVYAGVAAGIIKLFSLRFHQFIFGHICFSKTIKKRIILIFTSTLYLSMTVYIGFALLSCTQGQPANYYVSTNGNDNDDGLTKDTALETVQEAADRVGAGDTVFVLPGKYKERINISQSGGVNIKIVFISSTSRTAIIDGGFEIEGDYIEISGFTITTSLNDKSLENVAAFIQSDEVDIYNNYFVDVKFRAIQGDWDSMPRNVRIKNNKIFHSQTGIVAEGENWIVEKNEIERLFDYGNGDCDYIRFFGKGHIFRNNYFHGTLQFEVGDAHVDCFQTWDNGGKSVNNIIFDGIVN